MAKAKLQTQATKPATTATPTSAVAATAAQVATAVTAAPAAPIKKPPVAYVNGVANGAPANAPVVQLGGAAYNGALPATNPSNRGVVGTVSAKVPQQLTLGNGKAPRSPHGAAMWAAVQAALASGPQSAATLATAAGSGGAAFVAYALKHGWLAKA